MIAKLHFELSSTGARAEVWVRLLAENFQEAYKEASALAAGYILGSGLSCTILNISTEFRPKGEIFELPALAQKLDQLKAKIV